MEAGEEKKLKTEGGAGEEGESRRSNSGKSVCCFSSKIFCFFAVIFILSVGIMIGKYLGEKRDLPPDFCANEVFINDSKL